jgi:hypothetical protein
VVTKKDCDDSDESCEQLREEATFRGLRRAETDNDSFYYVLRVWPGPSETGCSSQSVRRRDEDQIMALDGLLVSHSTVRVSASTIYLAFACGAPYVHCSLFLLPLLILF